MTRTGLPRDDRPDLAPGFFLRGYPYISERCSHLGSTRFETRFLGQPAVCVVGVEGARSFYQHHLTRAGAMPPTAFRLLQDEGSVAQLDGEAHRRRKELFLSLVGPDRLSRLLEAAETEWRLAAERWKRADRVVLLDEVEGIHCRAAAAWAGVPLGEPEAQRRTTELSAMIDGAGSIGLRNLRGHLLRRRTERWLAGMVSDIRAGSRQAPAGSPLHELAQFRQDGGQLLSAEVAAVELINILRPTVAVARYVVFEALALHQYPEAATDDAEAYAHETRRYFPFFPVVAGRARSDVDLDGARIPAGWRVLLDLYGTNRSPDHWDHPDQFRPRRFAGRQPDPYGFVPQGGGDHLDGHRCPGEWATVEMMKLGLRMLDEELGYEVPDQDLRVRPARMPAQPTSRFVIRSVRRR